MTTRPRTRRKSSTKGDLTEERIGGQTSSLTEVEEHKPSKGHTIDGLIARVTMRDGVTLNMGDFNSFRREVGLEIDVPLPEGSVNSGELDQSAQNVIDSMHDKMAKWIGDKMQSVVDDARDMFD